MAIYKYGNYSSYTQSGDYNIYKITKSWQETGTNWSSPWSKAGGDYGSTKLGSYNYNGSENNVWHTFDVKSAVEEFIVNPGSNFGFLIIAEPSGTPEQENYYRSSDYTTQSERPKLTVTYDTGNDTEPPVVSVTAPNGGEIIKEGMTTIITWSATDNVAVVSCKVSYCTDARATWTLIEEISGNPGTLTWSIPNTPSNTCKIMVEAVDAAGNKGSDESDDPFIIDPASNIVSNNINLTPQQVYTVIITDIRGREITSVTSRDIKASINTLNKVLPSGMHIMTIKNADTQLTRKTLHIR